MELKNFRMNDVHKNETMQYTARLIYVGDPLIASSSEQPLSCVKEKLRYFLKMRVVGVVGTILGINVKSWSSKQ